MDAQAEVWCLLRLICVVHSQHIHINRLDGGHQAFLSSVSVNLSPNSSQDYSYHALPIRLLSSLLLGLPFLRLLLYSSIQLQCRQLPPRCPALKRPDRTVLLVLPIQPTSFHRYPPSLRDNSMLPVRSAHLKCL